MKRVIPLAIVLLATSIALFLTLDRTRLEEARRVEEQKTLPTAIPFEEVSPITTSGIKTAVAAPAKNSQVSNLKSQIPPSINLAAPFTSQAPFGIWDDVHEETCEEASVAMADAFYTKRTFTPESADRELLALVEWQKTRFGHWEDTDAEEVATIAREYYGFKKVEVREDVTVESIKREISKGNLVILPVFGQGLNPFFTPPGPDYHMLLVKGFTETKFITNDPGTRRGADFTYTFNKLLTAVHDWNDGNVLAGRKVMIVVYPK